MTALLLDGVFNAHEHDNSSYTNCVGAYEHVQLSPMYTNNLCGMRAEALNWKREESKNVW